MATPSSSLTTRAITLVRSLLERGGFVVESVEVVEAHLPHPLVMVRTKEGKALIGKRGETLRALNVVVRTLLEGEFGKEGRHLLVDVNRYHLDEVERLRAKVRMVAERVRTFATEAPLSPMSPYERMVVHAMFADDPDITTESRGEGRSRHVVLMPRERRRFLPWEEAAAHQRHDDT